MRTSDNPDNAAETVACDTLVDPLPPATIQVNLNASADATDPKLARRGRRHIDLQGLIAEASHPDTTPDRLEQMTNLHPQVTVAVAGNPNTLSTTLRRLAKPVRVAVRAAIAGNPNADLETLKLWAAGSGFAEIRRRWLDAAGQHNRLTPFVQRLTDAGIRVSLFIAPEERQLEAAHRLGAPVVELLMDFDASYNFVENDGTTFWFKTDLNSPRSRIIAIDVAQPQRANWKEIIPQTADTMGGINVLNDQFVVSYLHDAHTVVKVFKLDGSLVREVALPGLGTAGGFGGKRNDTESFYSFTSFTTPGTIYRYDATTGASTVFRAPKVDFEPSNFETKQVFFTSKDGTRVPMLIVHKKGLKLDGLNPTLLHGYGGFNISLTPSFSVSRVAWLEMGGVYALANLRGGGEYGEDWHQAGTKLQKQNVFDDFIGAAEWLIANKYTSSKKLAIQGGSNGGLLVGACMVQRPDLFGAALPAVGVMDMLRFHKFTIGWAWCSDFGSSDNADEFKALYKYSPYHNLKPGVKYPSTMVTTADRDDRVVPAHSFKFAARLQEFHNGNNPVLIRIEVKAGHGAGKPTSKQIEEKTDELSFLKKELGI